MSKDRHEQVGALFLQARELPLDDRPVFLDNACADDAALRAEVESLLAGEVDAPTLSNVLQAGGAATEAVDPAALPSRRPQRPDHVGPYKIIEEIGEGGMGTVYLAEQREPIHRRVALKIIKAGMATKEVLARFEVEQHALTIMNHANIARVYDAGATRDGRPYFVMEHVPGIPINDYCDRNQLSPPQRLDLFIDICEAVQHAHHKGVIHRDLKPSNILIMMQDGSPIPKVIDFGVAKATGQRLTHHTLHTGMGQIIGTPEYMSPEQAEMKAIDIDTRSDVYSLGVILYELLVGALPFDSVTLRRAGYAEIQRIIREVDPPRPSTRLSALEKQHSETVARRRASDLHTLLRHLRGDLDWIIMKALEKDRTRRYETANGLAMDIQRYLDNEAVLARPPSAGYKFQKFVRKHRGLVTATAIVILSLVAGVVGTTLQWQRAEQNEQLAAARAEEATAAAKRERDARALADSRYQELIRLADLKRLTDARATAEELWPAYPEKIAAMERWLEDEAKPLQKNLPSHRESLETLRRSSIDFDSASLVWTFEDSATQWQHDKLAELVVGIETFVAQVPARGTMTDVERRLDFARTITERSLTGPAAAWADAIADIAVLEVYGGLHLQPQLGLVPLHRDPRSGLWEFWHVQTGARPEPNPEPEADNPWNITGDTGLVFVLLPGGTFLMGAQREALDAPNYDSGAGIRSRPVHAVTLDPFFMSKYEMTQGQWQRFTGSNPSKFSPGWYDYPQPDETIDETTAWSPVEQVTWIGCTKILERLALVLPTEAQWEYAARAETTTIWWTGDKKGSIADRRAGNLADALSRSKGTPTFWVYEDWEDDWTSHAPVGSFRPNLFGLHDTIGNVREWCRDWYWHYENSALERRTGLRSAVGAPPLGDTRIARGGAFFTSADPARSAHRKDFEPEYRDDCFGLRPARMIEP